MSEPDLGALPLSALWQSSALLFAGLAAARLLDRRPARAHGALLCALAGAVAAPLAGATARALGLGWLAPAAALDGAGAPPAADAALGRAALGIGAEGALALAWVALAALALVRLARGVRAARAVVRAARPASSPAAERALRDAARRLGLARAPELRVTERVSAPAVWGFGRAPVVLLPPGFDAAELRPLLCHELAHVLRRDHWTDLAAEVARCALWWNPLAHAARRRLRAASERACDAWALAAGEEPAGYAAALLAAVPGAAPRLALPSVGLGGLGRRVAAVLSDRPAPPRAGRAFRGAALALALVAVAGLALAQRRPAELSARFDVLPPERRAELAALFAAARGGVCALPAVLDLGEVEPGGTGRGSVWLANAGDAPRAIESVKASCGCVALADVAGRALAPGALVELPLTMEAHAEPGREKVQRVTVLFDGDTAVAVELRLRTSGAGG